ncbi:MAG: universal stress protein [Deltaproteobacteria bacterium]|nr:universal stress protein [Deltaproteobacteria bacterium]
MLQIRSLLVPVDFSTCSDRAADWATELAARFGASVTLLHIVELPRGLDRASLVNPGGAGDVAMVPIGEWASDSGRKQLNRLARRLSSRGVPIQVRVEEGSPVHAILDVTTETKPDAIVMGTHGRKGLAHAFMGSVAERVVRAAECPVITLKADNAIEQPTEALLQAQAEAAG